MSNRANGEGSVYKRADGKWVASVTVDKKRVVFYAKTPTEAKAKLKAALARTEAGAPVKDAKMTVADWAAKWRTTALAASSRRESTKALYGYLCEKHIEVGPFGLITLDKLSPSDIDTLILTMRSRPSGKSATRTLSDPTIRQTYTVLRTLLDGAVRDGLIATNVATRVTRPGIARHEAEYLVPADVDKVLAASKVISKYRPSAGAPRFPVYFQLLAASGLRRGEGLALHWDALDLDAGELRVTATLNRVNGALIITEPKTERSRRTIPLAPKTVALLREHRTQQVAERLIAGSRWVNNDLVFCTATGEPHDPRNALRAFTVATKAAGFDVGLHVLRHSFATALLRAGVDIVTVSALLGHSSVAVTGDIYGHVSTDHSRAAVTALVDGMGR